MVASDSPTRVPFPLHSLPFPYRPRLLWGNSRHLMKRSAAPTVQARLLIIFAAADLFHMKGVRAGSLDEICKAATVSIEQLHHHFRAKGDIAEPNEQPALS